MLLEISRIDKSFNSKRILRGVSIQVEAGEIIALLGPSGCGKTTLLRIVAGLEQFDGGTLLYNNEELSGIPVHERGFGLVFQDYALFPHKDVSGNVEFGLRMLGWEEDRRKNRIRQVLELVGLTGFEKRKIHELSGGEQQRIALARSLAPSPKLLLLDEPMGSLDRALRERLMRELRTILKEAGDVLDRPEGITAIFVTHDQEEAFAVADRVLVMNEGQIEQEGSPVDLYRRPTSVFVAQFLGMDNILRGEIVSTDPPVALTEIGELVLPEGRWTTGQRINILVRPEAAELYATSFGEYTEIKAKIREKSFRGRYQEVTFDVSDRGGASIKLEFDFDTDVSLPPDSSEITLYIDQAGMIILDD